MKIIKLSKILLFNFSDTFFPVFSQQTIQCK